MVQYHNTDDCWVIILIEIPLIYTVIINFQLWRYCTQNVVIEAYYVYIGIRSFLHVFDCIHSGRCWNDTDATGIDTQHIRNTKVCVDVI
jgi:hypothetical protein